MACAIALACLATACTPELPVAVTREVVHLHGDAYQRGKTHGTRLRSKARAFYTKLLASALLPNLNREQAAIAGFLVRYQGAVYQNGRFSFELLLEMARSAEPTLPDEFKDELRGIADGTGLAYDEVLILNTFADTVMAVRSIAATLRFSHGPRLSTVTFHPAAAPPTGNKGAIDYVALPHALTAEVAPDAAMRLVFVDKDGVLIESLRLTIGDTLYTSASPELSVDVINPTTLAVTVQPKGAWPKAQAIGVVLDVADKEIVVDPPPAHPRFGRGEGFTFTTQGDGRAAEEVANVAPDTGLSQPPPVAVGLRGAATQGGGLLLGQHFALLDAGAAHETTVLLVHHLPDGTSFATVGWAGIAWGFSGLSEGGLGIACNFSDTLDNAIVKDLLPQVSDLPSATLTAKGWPIGLAMRAALQHDTSVDAAIARWQPLQHLMGWVCLLGDKDGAMRAVEIDADARLIPQKAVAGVFVVPGTGPGEDGGKAGANRDELAVAVHYTEHVVDVDPAITTVASALLANSGLNVRIAAQSEVSSYYLKSLRTAHRLGGRIAQQRGSWDVASLQALLGEPAFVDTSDSMNAVVLQPAEGKIHHAMGDAPATLAPWQTFTFAEGP